MKRPISSQIVKNKLKLWTFALSRVLVLAAVTSGLCSCGVCQVVAATANPNDDDANMTAAMDVIFPPLLITGYWPQIMKANAQNVKTPSDYAVIIRTRNDGKMTPERSTEILAAMDQVFNYTIIKDMSEPQIEKLIGPPDKTIVRSGKTIDVYQVHSLSGLQERWLVRGA